MSKNSNERFIARRDRNAAQLVRRLGRVTTTRGLDLSAARFALTAAKEFAERNLGERSVPLEHVFRSLDDTGKGTLAEILVVGAGSAAGHSVSLMPWKHEFDLGVAAALRGTYTLEVRAGTVNHLGFASAAGPVIGKADGLVLVEFGEGFTRGVPGSLRAGVYSRSDLDYLAHLQHRPARIGTELSTLNWSERSTDDETQSGFVNNRMKPFHLLGGDLDGAPLN